MKLAGPVQVLGHHGVRNEARYYSAHLRFLMGRGLHPRLIEGRPDAYVSEGRWCADCPECNAGISVAPDWKACCFGCGATFAQAVFPDEWEAIEDSLIGLPIRDQNWRAP